MSWICALSESELTDESVSGTLIGEGRSAVSGQVACEPGLPVVWADHDRLEQVFTKVQPGASGEVSLMKSLASSR